MASGVGAQAATSAGEQQLFAAHQALKSTRGLQLHFSTFEVPQPPAWVNTVLQLLAEFAPVLKYVFWGGLIIGVLLIAWLIVRELIGVRLSREPRVALTHLGLKPEPARAHALLGEADELARAGRYGDAIHVLLFRSIDDLASRRPGLVRPALTSRDIAGLEVLPGEPRNAFARIAEAVERSFFGGRPVGEEDFAAARSAYESFAFSEAWR